MVFFPPPPPAAAVPDPHVKGWVAAVLLEDDDDAVAREAAPPSPVVVVVDACWGCPGLPLHLPPPEATHCVDESADATVHEAVAAAAVTTMGWCEGETYEYVADDASTPMMGA